MSEPCIENVESRSCSYKGPVPSRRLRESLSVGNRAKVMLTMAGDEIAKPLTELVWLEVIRCLHNGRYHGRRPSTAPPGFLPANAIIEFGPEHVCDWQPS